MCVLAAQQDNETNAANDYSMSGKTNRVRAREEAADVKPCQVQLDHLRSFAGRADKVQFVQHISVHLSHMCSPLAAFSAALWANIRTFPRNPLRERCPDLLPQGGYGGEIYPALHVRTQFHISSSFWGFFIRKDRKEWKKNLFWSVFLLSLSFSFTHGVSFCCTHRDTRGAVPCGEWLTYAIQLAGYFCLCEWAAVSLGKL